MSYDNLIECSKCGSDACYMQEVNEKITLEMCYGCGFQSNSLMTEGSEFLQEQYETLPELYKALAVAEVDNGKVWLPSTTNIPGVGMVFADGTNREQWAWAGVKSVETTDEDKDKLNGAEWKPDMSTIKHFAERDFIGALEYIGVLPN